MKYLSTTALAKTNGISSMEQFEQLAKLGYIAKDSNKWALTDLGTKIGGTIKESSQYGQYITWPEGINIDNNKSETQSITSTVLGKHFDLTANKINFILSELGWIQKSLKGWIITEQGIKLGGIQSEDKKSGIPYVRWTESILNSKSFIESIGHVKGTESTSALSPQNSEESIGFRDKFEAKHRSADGHLVRSKAEMLIDNWLYMAEIVHAYERKLPIEEDVYCDFYIPTGRVYIEYWGYDNDAKYIERKKKKIDLYNKYGFNLIELQDKDVQNLDDILPRLLLKYGVQAY
jgi:hypothetical protein